MNTPEVESGNAGGKFLHIERVAGSRGYRLEAAQLVPRSRDEVFAFFADARNLQVLTPAFLHFEVLTPPPVRMAQGTLIDYRLRIHRLPLRWQSCISQWEPPTRFVDEQRRGPYRSWRHEHTFEIAPGGTLCRDVVDYQVYGGGLIHALLVRRDLLRIFAYRQRKLLEMFPPS